MNAKIFVIAAITGVTDISSATTIRAPSEYTSLEASVRSADVIAIVDITEGRVTTNKAAPVVYHADVSRVISGSEYQTLCIEGGPGLRVGCRYLAVLELERATKADAVSDSTCGAFAKIGTPNPVALEVVDSPNGRKQVRLDSERLLYPHFGGETPVIQVVSGDDGEGERRITIGTWAPLDDVVGFVLRVRSQDADED